MKKYDVIIVGGGPAGVITAVTAKRTYRDKSIALIRKVEKAIVPCGIPYVFKSMESVDKDIMPDKPLEANNIDLIINEVVEIDRQNKQIMLADGKKMGYDRLVLAVGSTPVALPIPGVELENVFYVKKDLEYLRKMREAVYNSKNIVIIGGGFIGAEFADELSNIEGVKVHIVEILPHCLMAAFDSEFAAAAQKELEKKGVICHNSVKVERIEGDGKVERVILSDGQVLDADMVIVSTGARPNTELAVKAGLAIGRGGGIWVDEYMRTSDPNIFAVGDCAEKRDFFTRKHVPVMLASTATAEARIAGANLYNLKVIRENRGTIATFSTKIGEFAFGAAGLTEAVAKREGFEVVVGTAESVNRHPGCLPGAQKIKVKLVFTRYGGVLLGGQVMGPESVGELINAIALAIQSDMTAVSLDTLQFATHPLLTPAPTVYPLVNAAGNALRKMTK